MIAQPLLTALVPAAERFDIGGLRADSYIPIVVSAVLCFGVGYWSRKRERSRQVVGSLVMFPLCWLGYMLWMIHLLGARTLVEYASSMYPEVAGVVPLGALVAGWTIAGVGQSTSGSGPA